MAFGLVVQTLSAQQPASQAPPTFKSSVNLVLVDVVVRDRSGAAVRDLTADDFELLEDGRRQQILTFAFEEISSDARPVENTSTLSNVTISGTAPAPSPRSDDTPAAPLTSEDVSGHRLLTIVFDTSSMQ